MRLDFRKLLCSGYSAPYLSVYSENAVDVFDVNTMEWIQTIPPKKVRVLTLCAHLLKMDVNNGFLWFSFRTFRTVLFVPLPQVRPLNVDGSLNLLGLETVRLIYFRNKMAGEVPHTWFLFGFHLSILG